MLCYFALIIGFFYNTIRILSSQIQYYDNRKRGLQLNITYMELVFPDSYQIVKNVANVQKKLVRIALFKDNMKQPAAILVLQYW
jgi:hypothetical protein